ncbi:hypothetical protein K6V35_06420 [Streptococcus suis]|nr:hypothetical protein [Streptococcus suis]MBY5039313.1 hypothetical protein [Streptococcus suis]
MNTEQVQDFVAKAKDFVLKKQDCSFICYWGKCYRSCRLYLLSVTA